MDKKLSEQYLAFKIINPEATLRVIDVEDVKIYGVLVEIESVYNSDGGISSDQFEYYHQIAQSHNIKEYKL
jgi:hypothetical protein